jgi:hypothetical protein
MRAMLTRLKSWLGLTGGPDFQAASKLAPVETPKVKAKQQSVAPYAPGATPSTAVLVRNDRQTANTDLLTFRRKGTTPQVLRELIRVSPDLSATVFSYLRMALGNEFKLKAYNMDGSFNVDATRLGYELLTRFDLVPDYSTGFSQINSMLSTAEALGLEMILEGACSLELVLDKARLPAKIVPLSVSQIKFYEDDKGLRPVQEISGVEIDLDIPTFFYVSLDQDLRQAYASSMLESAIQPTLADNDFTNDLRRVIKRAAFPRMAVTINFEDMMKSVPPLIRADPIKLAAHIEEVRQTCADVVNGLQPEDALVNFDFIEVKYIEGGTHDQSDVYQTVQTLMNGKMSTGAKAMPSVLGHGSGTQNIASSETLLAMKNANGVVRLKVNEVLSKALTLGVRLFGLDVAVRYEMAEIDLRPANELEAFRAMRQARLLEQLSLGLVTDEEACIDLTGKLPPDGFKPLSGTGFFQAGAGASADNPYSGTSNGGSGGGAMNQSLKPATPTKTKGASK